MHLIDWCDLIGDWVAVQDEKSEWRRELNKQTLVFSHMLSELKTIFKEAKYSPEFKIVKVEAREFWEKEFGKRCGVCAATCAVSLFNISYLCLYLTCFDLIFLTILWSFRLVDSAKYVITILRLTAWMPGAAGC